MTYGDVQNASVLTDKEYALLRSLERNESGLDTAIDLGLRKASEAFIYPGKFIAYSPYLDTTLAKVGLRYVADDGRYLDLSDVRTATLDQMASTIVFMIGQALYNGTITGFYRPAEIFRQPVPITSVIPPTPIQPVPIEPVPIQPVPIQPVPIEPVPIEPVPIEPIMIQPGYGVEDTILPTDTQPVRSVDIEKAPSVLAPQVEAKTASVFGNLNEAIEKIKPYAVPAGVFIAIWYVLRKS